MNRRDCVEPDYFIYTCVLRNIYGEYTDVPGYERMFESPTLVAFKCLGSHNTIIIGVRGTKLTDVYDLSADASLPVGRLFSTVRYKRDKLSLEYIIKTNPRRCFYFVGHSLGGAIIRQFESEFSKSFSGGIAFNGAFQPMDFFRKSKIVALYTDTDFLGNNGGRRLPNVLVIPAKNRTWVRVIDPFIGHGTHNFLKVS